MDILRGDRMQIIEYVNGLIDTEMFVKQVKKAIKDYRNTKQYKAMISGIAYYEQENIEIMERRKTYYSQNRMQPMDDPYKANHKLPSGYMKLLVDQKVNYSVNDKMDITKIDIKIDLEEIGTETSIKAISYVQFYEEEKKLKYKLVPTEQCVPIYEMNQFVAMIREYIIDGITYVGIYTADVEITFVLKDDKYTLKEIKPILTRIKIQDGKVIENNPLSWGRPPFAMMYNNNNRKTDLQPIRNLVDVYDLTNSDFANNIDDFQDAYWKLKGFGGEDLDEYMNQVKRFKTLIVGEDGDASVETIQIPTEARKVILEILERNIYKFGMGVNYDTVTGNTTATEIRAKTMNLDLKANAFEKQYRLLLEQFEYFINKYNEFTKKDSIEPIEVKFNRATIVNKAEEVETLSKIYGMISKETFLELLPYGIDVEQELERIADEQKAKENSLGDNMGFGDE